MPLTDPKMRNSVVNAIKCLKCEICAKESQGLLPGLCTSHVFCRQCSTDNSSCPSCKTTFNMKNSSVVFSISPEILATLYSLERILKAKPVRECTPAKVPQRKSTSYIPPTGFQQSALATPSPAKSDVTVASSRQGRRSSLSSPMPDVNKRNTKGETLIHTACIKKNFDEVKRLIGLGANCSVRDYNGWTPLHEAAQSNRLDIAGVLLEHGAKVNAAGGEEYLSPLHDAVSANFTDMVKLLLKFGADPKQLSIKGETSKDMTKDSTILSLLKKAESQPFTPQTLVDSSTVNSVLFADGRPLIVMSSGLDKAQKASLTTFMKTFSAKSASKPTVDVKLVIAADENNICQTSSAVLAGIAAGAWVLRPEWVKSCLENGRLVDPESYELYSTSGSNCGQVFRKARVNTENMLPGLFAGCNVFFGNIENYGNDLGKDTVAQLVKVMGGRVVTRSPDPEDTSATLDIPFHAEKTGPLAKCSHLIIFERGKTKKNFIEFNMQHIKALQYSWLLNCIENFSLLNP